ncbi:MAG: DUF2804 domain-containing protein [Promethearchaeota archaeon]|nr:MAG: DUF2804 domain-containing protein [Candidatus Lokiarchaeota archaeon]
MQKEITKPSKLLSPDGSLKQRGWARKPILEYNREDIAVPWYRIKEWSHYSVLDKEQGFGFQMTLGDIGYLTLIGFTWLDFKTRKSIAGGTVRFLTKGKYTFPRSSMDIVDIPFPGWNYSAVIKQRKGKRILLANYPRFGLMKGLKCAITLIDDLTMDNTVVATGYSDNPHHFYYNHKVNYMPAHGWIQLGKKRFTLNPETSFGLLDWGRGVWPYRTHWLWASACGKQKGVPIAWNLGYGFGDLATHTENIVFYDGKAHKLDKVTFHHQNRDPTQPWRFTDNEGRLDLELKPLISSHTELNMGILLTDSSLLHGLWSGEIVLDDGETIKIDSFLGHAEDIYWRW